MKNVIDLSRDQSGGTAMEYGFVLGIVSLAGFVAYGSIANSIDNLIYGVSSELYWASS